MTVSYKHLIIASGLKQTILGSSYEEDLSGGVHALWEALRIRKNISDSMIFPELNHLGFNRRKKSYQTRQRIARDIPIKNIQNILPPKLNDSKSLEMMLGGSEKRLYELQL
jgi:hypothetical protein